MIDLRRALGALALLTGCAAPPPPAVPKSEAPAKVSGSHPKESDLTAITLTRRSRNQTGKSDTMPEWALNY